MLRQFHPPGIRNAQAGYHVSAEFMGVSVGATANAKIDSINIYFEVGKEL